jgi:hypothetical protein
MGMDVYFIIIAVLTLFGAAATIMIGNSKENKEGNPSYDTKAGGNWIRLTAVYAVSTVAALILLLLFLIR